MLIILLTFLIKNASLDWLKNRPLILCMLHKNSYGGLSVKISLEFIMEKLNLNIETALLIAPHNSVFSEVLLLSPKISTLKSGILYIGDKHLNPDLEFEQGCGLLIQNSIQEMLPCDVLYVVNTIPFEELYNQICEVFIYYRNQIENLTHLIYEKKGLQLISEKISEICENPIYIVDSSFKVIAIKGKDYMCEEDEIWKALIYDHYLPFNIIISMMESNELIKMESSTGANLIDSEHFGLPFINYNMRHKGKLQGHWFVLSVYRDLLPGDIELANIIGPLVLQAILTDPCFQITRGRHYEHFIIDMIEGKNIKEEHMDNQASAIGFDNKSFYATANIKPSIENELISEQIASQLEHFDGSKPIIYKDFIVAIFQFQTKNNYSEFVDKLQILSNQFKCTIGVSDIMQAYTTIRFQFIQAYNAITIGQILNESDNLYLYRDYAIYSPFLKINNQNDFMAICHPDLKILFDYDKNNNTDLVLTLEVYLKNERHSQLTASKLHIHRNTLSYRLDKINDICHFDLCNYKERERILHTLNIHKFLNKFPVKP